jgi:CDP-diacylglycerol--glycerol-3-phosphate 3-phosphatidyltransferase
MAILSNCLSFCRAPLAFLFLQENPSLRLLAVLLAALTDSIDGYLARRFQATTRFGTILDPATDKFFVYFALCIFYTEHKIAPWQIAAMLSRDAFLCFYALLMISLRKWKAVVFRSVRWGKITTVLQFAVLISLILNISISPLIFIAFILMGWLAFTEFFFFTSSEKSAPLN